MFSIDLSPVKEFKKFFEPLPGLLKFLSYFLLAGIPIILYIFYPYFYGQYIYLGNIFILWLVSGAAALLLTCFIHPALGFWRKENQPTFFFHKLLLLIFWVSSIFLPVTNSSYKNGGQLAIEQTGRCDLVHKDERQACLDRKKDLSQNSGIFSVVSGYIKGDGNCSLKLSETLPSGLLRKAAAEVGSDLCQKVKVTDLLNLTSKLQEEGKPCEGLVRTFTHAHEGDMPIQVCTSYSLIVK